MYFHDHLKRRLSVMLFIPGYFNPFLAYGVNKLMDDVVASGADGFIVVDLPPEEGR